MSDPERTAHTDHTPETDPMADDMHSTTDHDSLDEPPTAETPTTDGGETTTTAPTSSGPNRNVARYVNYAVLGGLCLLAFIAALQFYFSTSQAINTWVTREYRSLFQAAFNLVIVFLAGTGIAFQLRRLYGE